MRPALSEDPVWQAQLVSFAVVITLIAVVLIEGLVPAAFFGLLVFTAVRLAARPIEARLSPGWSRLIALAVIATLIVAVLAGASYGVIQLLIHAQWQALLERLQQALDALRVSLPANLADALPADTNAVIARVSGLLQDHARTVSELGLGGLRSVVLCLITGIIASMVAVERAGPEQGPLGAALGERIYRIWDAFRKILFAQAKISVINTVLTSVYLWAALPAFGVHLPHSRLLVIATFLLGFVPVLGNLLSNGAIVLLSFTVSPQVAGASLVFLLVIHQLEYFLNARRVGSEVECKAWELLCVMLLGESLFGASGVVAAPILYSWAKSELGPLLTRKALA